MLSGAFERAAEKYGYFDEAMIWRLSAVLCVCLSFAVLAATSSVTPHESQRDDCQICKDILQARRIACCPLSFSYYHTLSSLQVMSFC
jgi:hypothetical protein